MSDKDRLSGADDPLFSDAAAWFARMRGPEAEARRGEFERWLARSAAHREAYNRAAEIFAMGKLLGAPPAAGKRSTGRGLAVVAVVLLALLGTWALMAQRLEPARTSGPRDLADAGTSSERLATARDPRLVRLPDGSRARLQSETMLEVRFSDRERRLRLERGRARFEVARGRRPFVVLAGGGSIVAHGTIFEVALAADRRVSLRGIEGRIDVSPPGGADRMPGVRRLRPGETMTFAAQPETSATVPAASPRAPAERGRATAHEARDFDRTRLADVIGLANRTAVRPIRLADPGLGEERISGRFRIDDPELLAQRIAHLFGLQVDRGDPAAIVLRPRQDFFLTPAP